MPNVLSRAGVLAAIAGVAMAMGAGAASAQSVYVTGFGGLNETPDLDFGGLAGGTRSAGTTSGFVVGAAIGTTLGESFRVEGELAYRSNSFDTLRISGAGTGVAGGDAQVISLMANTWYDLPVYDQFTLSLGGGVGGAWVTLGTTDLSVPAGGVVLDGTDFGFAYQLGAGASYTLSNGMSIGLGYRYLNVGNLGYDLRGGPGSADVDYQGHSVMATFTVPIGRILAPD